MTRRQLMKKIAYLEFVQDQLNTELTDVDRLLRVVGFNEGLTSAKAIAEEMIEELENPESPENLSNIE